MQIKARTRNIILEFIAVSVVIHVVGIYLLQDLKIKGFDLSWNYVNRIREVGLPEKGNWFVSYDRGSSDHHALFHDVHGASAQLREADVIVLGNSRVQAALRPEVVVPYFDSIGLDYYNLGFAHRESHRFPMMIFEKFDLAPEIVIINADQFFESFFSETAKSVVEISRFDAWKHVWEKNASFGIRKRLHEVYPLISNSSYSLWIVFRNIDHGSWDFRPSRWFRMKLVPGKGVDLPNEQVENARRVVEFFESRGTRVVLTTVPSLHVSLERWRTLAHQLDVAYLDVQVEDLELCDLSHLSEESALRFSRSFIDEYDKVIGTRQPTASRRKATLPMRGRNGERNGERNREKDHVVPDSKGTSPRVRPMPRPNQ